MKRFMIVLALFCLSGGFVSEPSFAANYGGILRYGLRADPTVIDPALGGDSETLFVKRLVCQPLVGVSVTNSIVPGLAESWVTSPDGLRIKFNLRKGVLFHNGRELTSDDVKFTLERIMDPKVGSPGREGLRSVESVRVDGRHGIILQLKKQEAGLFAFLAEKYASILPPESVGPDGKVNHPMGTGPFKFVEWKPNQHLRLRRNENYYEKGLPYLNEIFLKPIREPSVRLAGLRAGDLDIAEDFPLGEIKKLEGTKEFEFYAKPGVSVLYIAYNLAKPPFNDVRVRRAIAYATDKQEMSEAVFWGYALSTYQMYTSDSEWHLNVPEKYPKNILKAKELLNEAGYGGGLKAKILATDAVPVRLQITQVLQSQLKKIGIDLEIEMVDRPTFYTKWSTTDYSILVGESPVRPDPAFHYIECYHSKGPLNKWYGSFSIPLIDKLGEESSKVNDPISRKKFYTQIQDTIESELPFMVLLSIPKPFVWTKKVKGFEPSRGGIGVYQGGGLTTTWLQ